MTDGQQPPQAPPPGPPRGSKQIDVQIESTGRFVGVAAPVDLTDGELLELLAWLANPEGFLATLRPPSNIIVPSRFQGRLT